PFSVTEKAALDAWLAEEPLRQGALLRAQAVLAYLDRGCALAAGRALAGDDVFIETAGGRPSRRRFLQLVTGGAAALAAGLGTAIVLPHLNGEELRTDVGEVRRVPLAD